jgi:CRP/FNR family transcriptional regulator, nitrogen fixation regulation protein
MLMHTPVRSLATNSSNWSNSATSSTSSNSSPCALPRPVSSKNGPLGALDLMGSQMTFGPNEEIFGENEPAECVYKVASGAVRTCKILNDGRRQIGAFYLPGDVFGLEIGKEHQFSAEAIGNAVVVVVRRSAIVSLAERDCGAARALWDCTARELHRMQEHMLLLVKI